MRDWLVGVALIEQGDDVLFVRNLRRDGTEDWSLPGGVIEHGESVLDGAAREVAEETSLVVEHWRGLAYEVEVEAPDMGWRLRVEVHRATTAPGEVVIDDPDGIVNTAAWLDMSGFAELSGVPGYVREPLMAWFAGAVDAPRTFRFRVTGADRANATVEPLP